MVNKEPWEEEFDKKFQMYNVGDKKEWQVSKDIKSFIKDLIQQEREKVIDLLDENLIQHTVLKIEETTGLEFDRGYIFYQDMVLRSLEEVRTSLNTK